MKKLRFKTKEWPIIIRVNEGMSLVEIADSVDLSFFLRIIHEMFIGGDTIILSQFIDSDQLPAKRAELVNELNQKHQIELYLTRSYSNSDYAAETDSTFILNMVGPPSIELLSDVIRFGGTNLSNILYSQKSKPAEWLLELGEWNKIIISWFELEIPSTNDRLIALIGQVGPIALTIDGHLCFALDRLHDLNRLLVIISNIARESQLSLAVKLDLL